MGGKAPSFKVNKTFSKNELIENDKFVKYFYEYVAQKEVERDFNLIIDKIKEDDLPKVNKILFAVYKNISSDEKKNLKKFAIPKNASEFTFNREEMKLFIESLSQTKFDIVTPLFKKEVNEYKKDRVNKAIERLTQEQKDNLGGVLYYKTPELCSRLETWFKENELIAYS